MKPLLITGLAALLLACGSEASSAATLHGTLEYARSGGIAGTFVGATVKPSGKGTFTGEKRKSATLTSAERARLARYAEAADVRHVKVPKGSECCDTFEYKLSYRGRTLTWYDGVSRMPKKLDTLVSEIHRLIGKYGGGPGR